MFILGKIWKQTSKYKERLNTFWINLENEKNVSLFTMIFYKNIDMEKYSLYIA